MGIYAIVTYRPKRGTAQRRPSGGQFEEACTYESLANLREAKDVFANFEAVEI